jgi:tol-pal system beta propeller repeat protein TolB
MINWCRGFPLGVAALCMLAPAMQGQNRPVPARPKPQHPIEVPPAVVVLPMDTTPGDSTRTIIQRDFDFGDRIQPLVLDSTIMDDIWKPGESKINVSPLAQTRANFVVRGRPAVSSLQIEVFDARNGQLRQQAVFRLPKLPTSRLPAVKDSLSMVLAARARTTEAAIAAHAAARDSLAREATRPAPAKHPGQRVAARRTAAERDSLARDLDRRDMALRAAAAADTVHFDSVLARITVRDSILRDSVTRERRFAIHGVSDEVERWITGTRGIASTKIAFVEGKSLKVVDSDGANERLLPTIGAALSPSWHPTGRWIVYSDADDRGTRIAQIDLRNNRTQLLAASNRGLNITPVYTKDGKNIVWAAGGDSPAELFLASAAGDDSVAVPFVGRSGFETTSPTFSPDGKQVAFMSPRPLTPQLFMMNVDGTGLRPLTPVVAGKRSYRTGPDWSPNGTEIAFQQQNGDFQVWTITVKDRSMHQLTNEGENEDPSWAPDGRHMSITRRLGAIGDQRNIWVLDERTGRLRQLTQSGDARLSDWSPPLKAAF